MEGQTRHTALLNDGPGALVFTPLPPGGDAAAHDLQTGRGYSARPPLVASKSNEKQQLQTNNCQLIIIVAS